MRFFTLLLVATSGSVAWADPALAPITFDKPEALSTLVTSQAKVQVREGAAYINFAKTDWPNVQFVAGKAFAQTDWSNIGGIVFDVRNPGSAPLDMHVRADASENGEKFVRQGHEVVAPGERVKLVFTTYNTPPGMRAGPPVDGPQGARIMKCSGDWPSKGQTTAFQIFLARPSQPLSLELFSISCTGKPQLDGIVDRYGQYTKGSWPGKSVTDSDLTRARADEEKWLQDHPPLADRDEFGGWKSGPTLKATGFFRTQQVDGKWWLVTPKGHLFWSIGSTCVRPESSGPIRGRESMFTWLPDGAARSGHADFYQANLARKYGESWRSTWARVTCDRLIASGFNTIANWSHESVFELHRIPFTAMIHFGGLPPIGPKPEAGKVDHRLLDFFDESFPRKADEAIAKATARWRDDPWCIGYFVHNELQWDAWGATNQAIAARHTLASPPALAARKALVKMLQEKYGSAAAFAKAWGIEMTDWDQPVNVPTKQLNAAARADGAAFLTLLAQRYFSVVGSAMKKHAPNQLYLGCRFSVHPRDVVNVSAEYCDVVSFNIYRDAINPADWAFLNDLGKPVIIGEFHFGATDRGMFHTGLRATASQADRARAFASYVKSATAMPAIIGCHWFQYVDQPLTGRFDGENYNIGLVSITDTPYPELRIAAREINAQIYRLHRDK